MCTGIGGFQNAFQLYSEMLVYGETSLCLAEQRPLGWAKFIFALPCCFIELCEVREHDCKVTKEAEKAQEELAAAMQEAEANAK